MLKNLGLFALIMSAWIAAPLVLSAMGPHGGDSTRSSPWSGADVNPTFLNTSRWMRIHEEFLTTAADGALDGWEEVTIGGAGGTARLSPFFENSVIALDVDADVNEGIQFGLLDSAGAPGGAGGWFLAAADRTIIYETRLKVNDWDTSDFAFGLVDISLLSFPTLNADGTWLDGANDATEAIGFYCNDADNGVIQAFSEGQDNGIEEHGALNALFTDNVYHVFSFQLVGADTATWYIDGVEVLTATFTNSLSTASTDGMVPFFAIIGNDGDTNDGMDIDYVTVAQTR